MGFFDWIGESGFMPHGHCYLWRPDVLWLNAGSDVAIALAYYSIPVALIVFARKRPSVQFGWLLWMFGAFIFLCGTTHVMEVITTWKPVYVAAGLVKLATAAISVATAIVLWPVVPRALALPTQEDLEAANRELRRVHAELEERVRLRTAALEEANQALRREMAERERAEARFRLAVEASPSGNLMVDANGRILMANHALEQLFGYARAELIGQPVELLVPERLRQDHPRYRDEFLAEPSTRPMGAGRDLRGVRKDGSEVAIEIGLNPIETEDGALVLSSVVDITERQRVDREIRDYTARLERSNRELDEFAHVVSHDLKAPLRGIAALVSWIWEDGADQLSEASRENLKLLTRRAQRMGELIDGILEYSRVGRGGLSAAPVDAGALVRQILEMLPTPAGVTVRIDGELPTVRYDRVQLGQVFQNLLDNAIRHLGRPNGSVVVSARDLGDRVEFAVRDDGVGIEPQHHERIFKVFQSLKAESEGGGVGVGLAIVKRSVERHGGHVTLESAPGQGSTFRFTVPK